MVKIIYYIYVSFMVKVEFFGIYKLYIRQDGGLEVEGNLVIIGIYFYQFFIVLKVFFQ